MSVTSGGTAPKPCSSGGSRSASAGSAGIVIDLADLPVVRPSQVPVPDGGGEVLDRDDDADESPLASRVVRRAQLEHHLVLVAEVERLQMLARDEGRRRASRARTRGRAASRARRRSRTSPVFPTRWSRSVSWFKLPPEVVGDSAASPCSTLPSVRAARRSRSRAGRCRRPLRRRLRRRGRSCRSRRGHSERCAGGCSRCLAMSSSGSIVLTSVGVRGSALVSMTYVRDERRPGTTR